MSTAPAPLIARVSRRDLARNPFVWRATGGMTLFMAVGVAFMAFALTGRLDVRLAVVAIAFLVLSPASFAGIFCTILAIWVLAVSCWEVLQSAEAQGDELERLVRRDPLTGLGNLRLLEETLPEEIERHARAGWPLSVLCLDLTGFKALNDTLGHAEGDALLREVGAALPGATRLPATTLGAGPLISAPHQRNPRSFRSHRSKACAEVLSR